MCLAEMTLAGGEGVVAVFGSLLGHAVPGAAWEALWGGRVVRGGMVLLDKKL